MLLPHFNFCLCLCFNVPSSVYILQATGPLLHSCITNRNVQLLIIHLGYAYALAGICEVESRDTLRQLKDYSESASDCLLWSAQVTV